ncbi:hypothetical protein CKU38_04228 [Xanthomonas citri pv. fuscans]|nr:hypothetical protein CKU38_04228 [Xanthomonas citri pv. fuscans]
MCAGPLHTGNARSARRAVWRVLRSFRAKRAVAVAPDRIRHRACAASQGRHLRRVCRCVPPPHAEPVLPRLGTGPAQRAGRAAGERPVPCMAGRIGGDRQPAPAPTRCIAGRRTSLPHRPPWRSHTHAGRPACAAAAVVRLAGAGAGIHCRMDAPAGRCALATWVRSAQRVPGCGQRGGRTRAWRAATRTHLPGAAATAGVSTVPAGWPGPAGYCVPGAAWEPRRP